MKTTKDRIQKGCILESEKKTLALFTYFYHQNYKELEKTGNTDMTLI